MNFKIVILFLFLKKDDLFYVFEFDLSDILILHRFITKIRVCNISFVENTFFSLSPENTPKFI